MTPSPHAKQLSESLQRAVGVREPLPSRRVPVRRSELTAAKVARKVKAWKGRAR